MKEKIFTELVLLRQDLISIRLYAERTGAGSSDLQTAIEIAEAKIKDLLNLTHPYTCWDAVKK